MGTVVTYKLEFWQHLTVLLATTGKAHLGKRSRILCQIRSACACLPDWTLRAKDLIAMVSEPINRLGELVRLSVESEVRYLCEHWNTSKA